MPFLSKVHFWSFRVMWLIKTHNLGKSLLNSFEKIRKWHWLITDNIFKLTIYNWFYDLRPHKIIFPDFGVPKVSVVFILFIKVWRIFYSTVPKTINMKNTIFRKQPPKKLREVLSSSFHHWNDKNKLYRDIATNI